MKNELSFMVYGRHALFTDPVTRLGGEKCSYHIPTYEALKGVAKSIYWKPSFTWIIDAVRIMKPFRTQSRGMKPLKFHEPGNELSAYTYLVDVAYQVKAHFVWNTYRPELAADWNTGKHQDIARRMVGKGGRQDVFLGTRDCQGYVEPCVFGEGEGAYDDLTELSFGLMFHGFDYPDETGRAEFHARFWRPVMRRGVVEFVPPGACEVRKFIRPMRAKRFEVGRNIAIEEAEEPLPECADPAYPDARALLHGELS